MGNFIENIPPTEGTSWIFPNNWVNTCWTNHMIGFAYGGWQMLVIVKTILANLTKRRLPVGSLLIKHDYYISNQIVNVTHFRILKNITNDIINKPTAKNLPASHLNLDKKWTFSFLWYCDHLYPKYTSLFFFFPPQFEKGFNLLVCWFLRMTFLNTTNCCS